MASIFDRLHADPDEWAGLVSQLLVLPKGAGSHFGGTSRLAEAAQAHGRRWHRNQVPRALDRRGMPLQEHAAPPNASEKA